MEQIDIVNKLQEVFGRRQLFHHTGRREVARYGSDHSRVVVVLDLKISRNILSSRYFQSFNYFSEGYQRARESDNPLKHVRDFFDHNPLFLEGDVHRSIKTQMLDLLDTQCTFLDNIALDIQSAVKEKALDLDTALDFAHFFVEECLRRILGNFGCDSLHEAIQAIRQRSNVFYFHYHPGRQRKADQALWMLNRCLGKRSTSDPDDIMRTTSLGLIIMAFDPLVALVTANLVGEDSNKDSLVKDRICPVSFVTRKCVASCEIGGETFSPGDTCYVSLLPATDEPATGNLAFGAGAHVCVGIKVSRKILSLAKIISKAEFPNGFSKTPALSPDGAFLTFTQN